MSRATAARRVPILLYHSVTDDPTSALADYTVATQQLREHAAALADAGWSVLTIDELDRRIEAGTLGDERVVGFTFDDGFADNAEHAARILDEFDMRATLYVASGHINGSSEWLGDSGRARMASAAQLRDLAHAGWEIGAHTVSHPQLDVVSRARVREEIRPSRLALENMLGRQVDSFAYPHGYYSPRVREEVIKAGFRNACAVKNAPSSLTEDRFARARFTVHASLDATGLMALLNNGQKFFPERTPARTIAWRYVRRIRALAHGGAR